MAKIKFLFEFETKTKKNSYGFPRPRPLNPPRVGTADWGMDAPPAFSPHPLVVAESDPQPVAVGAVDASDVAAPQPALVTASAGVAASAMEAPHPDVVLSVVVQSWTTQCENLKKRNVSS